MTSARSERNATTAIQRRRVAFSGIEQRLLARWRRAGLPRGSTIVVAFSGGPDSLGLAAALGRIAPRFDARLHLVYIDHGLRPGSAREAAYARELAACLGLPIEVAAIPPGMIDRHPGVGLEEAARRERYLLLSRAAQSFGTDLLATGHHRDDQAETVLLHLLRGAGLTGAAAMREWSELGVPWWASQPGSAIRLWRPLLGEQKSELRRYVEQFGLNPIHDESNDDSVFRRNAIRHQLLPTIDHRVPGGREALARFAEIAGEEDRFLGELAAKATAAAVDDDRRLLVAETLNLPTAIRRRVLANWFEKSLPREAEATHERIVALEEFLHTASGDKLLEIGGGRVATKLAGKIVAGTRKEVEDACWARFAGPRLSESDELPRPLGFGEKIVFARFNVSLGELQRSYVEDAPRRKVRLRARDLTGPIFLRRVRAGDRFASGVPVAEWLSRRGVPALLRRHVICVAGAQRVVWVPGVGLPPASVPAAGEETVEGEWSEQN